MGTTLAPKIIRTPIALLYIGQSVTHGNVPVTQGTASFSGNQMTVTLTTGFIETAAATASNLGANVFAAGVASSVTVLSQVSGSPGGSGVYTLSASVGTIASEPVLLQIKEAFQSLDKPGLTAPLTGALSNTGGSLFRLIDNLWAHGYDLKVVNGAKGSMSLITHGAGQIDFRQPNSTGVFKQRKPLFGPDRGFFGTLSAPAGVKMFLATSARDVSVVGTGPFLTPAGGQATFDYIQFDAGTDVTAGASIVATVSDSQMTVSSVTTGTLAPSQFLYGSSAILNGGAGISITSQASGTTGGPGVYNLSASATLSTPTGLTTGPDFYSPNVNDTVSDGTVTWTCVALTGSLYGGIGGAVQSETQNGYGFDPLGILQMGFDQLQGVTGVVDRYVYIDGNQSDLSQTSASRQSAVKNAAAFFLSRGVKVIIGNQIYSPGSGSMSQHTIQNAANLAAYDTLLAGQYSADVFWGSDLYTALGTNLVSEGYMQADQIHLNGAGSMLQGDAYAVALEAILGKPGFQ